MNIVAGARLLHEVARNDHPGTRGETREASMRVDSDIVIQRPIEDVFDFVADERNESAYNR